jgi:hypothetical protein
MKQKNKHVFNEIITACKFHKIDQIMTFKYNWNMEVILLFYWIIFLYRQSVTLTCMIDEVKYTIITLDDFATHLGLQAHLSHPKKIHDERVLAPVEMASMFAPDVSATLLSSPEFTLTLSLYTTRC